ncbi:hypothetical protein V8G54_012414 [Vigna mungo]
MKLSYCKSENQVADIMTKPLKLDRFEKLRDMHGVMRNPRLSTLHSFLQSTDVPLLAEDLLETPNGCDLQETLRCSSQIGLSQSEYYQKKNIKPTKPSSLRLGHSISKSKNSVLSVRFRILQTMDAQLPNIKKWIVMYPVYINSKKTMAEGRRIAVAKACENPTCAEIGDCCSYLKLPFAIEIDKAYPRDFMQRGRVRVLLKTEDGTLINPSISSRKI